MRTMPFFQPFLPSASNASKMRKSACAVFLGREFPHFPFSLRLPCCFICYSASFTNTEIYALTQPPSVVDGQ